MSIRLPEPQENTVFLYHRADNDGFGAYFAARYTYEHRAAYYGIDYTDTFDEDDWRPVFAGRDVYFMDCVGPRDFMHFAAKEANSLTIIDHHEHAYHALRDLPVIYVFDKDKSAAVLAWLYLRPEDALPLMFMHIEDRDLWRWELPGSHEYNAGLDVLGHDYDAWCEALHNPEKVYEQGEAALSFKDKVVRGMATNLWECQLGGMNIGFVNATAHWSDVCHFILDEHPELDIAITWYEASPGRRKYSFRSRKDMDVRKLVQALGGGGHAQAAGMAGEEWPFVSMVWQTTEMQELDRLLTNVLSKGDLVVGEKEIV